jgi:anaerobic selenocysteine-containing dehydrogenase
VFVRPGTDAYLLFAMVHVLFAEGLTKPGRLAEFTTGIDEVRELAAEFSPEAVAPMCGVAADTIVRLARELSAAETGAVYARIGTCTQEFGTIASWLVDVLNLLTGNLDRAGGAVFPLAAAGQPNSTGAPGRGRGTTFGRWQSRVRGQGEVFGELPVVCLAEEIETPGDGQIRALITLSGNPALSAPNADRLEKALDSLDFMVSIDVYLNETTQHADVILPAPSPLRRSHYDLGLYQFAVHNAANYSPPVLEPEPELPDEWITLLRLVGVVTGQGPDADVHAVDDFVAGELVKREIGTVGSGIEESTVSAVLGQLAPRRGPERLLDLLLRVGAYGDKFGKHPDGLSLAVLEANPHGVDLGPATSRLPDALRTRSGLIELAPAEILADLSRLRAKLTDLPTPNGLLLVGRRDLRSNNSWMHNLPLLVRGSDRCTMHMHPADAHRLGLADGKLAVVRSRAGGIEVPVEVTDAIMPGVVSIPHGWGHDRAGARLGIASAHAGVNSNILTDDVLTDALTGNAVFNGIPVTVAPA